MLGTEDEFRCPACDRINLKHNGQKPLYCGECGRNIVDWESKANRFPFPERLIVRSLARKAIQEIVSEDQEDRILREYYARMQAEQPKTDVVAYNQKWEQKTPVPYSKPQEAGSTPKSQFDVIDNRINEVEKVQTALVGAFLKAPYITVRQDREPALKVNDSGCGLILGGLTFLIVCLISIGLILNHISQQKESKAPNFWNNYSINQRVK